MAVLHQSWPLLDPSIPIHITGMALFVDPVSHYTSTAMVFIMDSSFETLYCDASQSPPKCSRSPRFLTTVKELHKSISTKGSRTVSRKHTSRDSPCPSLQESSAKHILWKRRGQTPGMDDYLTMAQLENAWHKQDSFVGCVIAPQKISQYSYQEAVEAPLIASHITPQPSRRAPDLNSPLPNIPQDHDASFVDGAIHPALRSTPYLFDNSSSTTQLSMPLLRIATEVPDSNWTYGRD